jgi:hypothetical protein
MNVPIINSSNAETTARLVADQETREAVDRAVTRMRSDRVFHTPHTFEVHLTRLGALAFSLRCEEFERRGFTIIGSHSSLIGQEKDGTFRLLYTIHVKAPSDFLVTT